MIEKLKTWLQERRDNFITDREMYVDEGCTTCGGYYEDVPEIDEEALWAEIDLFCETFKEKV